MPPSAISAPAPAAPAQKPPVVGTPTFCLLVKNMFDPATETEDNWELDIKEDLEDVRALEDALKRLMRGRYEEFVFYLLAFIGCNWWCSRKGSCLFF